MRADVVEPCFVVANKPKAFIIAKSDGSQIAVFGSGSETFKLAIKGF